MLFSDDPRDRLRFFFVGGGFNHFVIITKVFQKFPQDTSLQTEDSAGWCSSSFWETRILIDPQGEFFHRRMGSFSWIFCFITHKNTRINDDGFLFLCQELLQTRDPLWKHHILMPAWLFHFAICLLALISNTWSLGCVSIENACIKFQLITNV